MADERASTARESTRMDSTATIVTSCKEIAEAIRACVPNKVLEIDPSFIELAKPGFNADFEPQFCTVVRAAEDTLRNLQGTVICAVSPGLSHGDLLLHLAHTVGNGRLVYAPLHEIHAEGIARALNYPEDINPWFLTSVVADRMVERLLGERLIPELREQNLPYPGWHGLFYLQLVRDAASPSWKRHLHFGNCVAVEIDSFGGTIHHSSYPTQLDGVFEVVQKEVPALWPDLQCAVNQVLRHAGYDIEQCQQELERAYYSGTCSWPFAHGGVSYGERPFQVRPQRTGLLRQLPAAKPARKLIRVYRKDGILFRSVTYRCDGQSPINPLPSKAQVKVTVDPQLPGTTMEALLERLDGYQLNLDLAAFLQLIRSGYVRMTDGDLAISPRGKALLCQADRLGLTCRRLYLILRLLENIQTDEASYSDVLRFIRQKLFGDAPNSARKSALAVATDLK